MPGLWGPDDVGTFGWCATGDVGGKRLAHEPQDLDPKWYTVSQVASLYPAGYPAITCR